MCPADFFVGLTISRNEIFQSYPIAQFCPGALARWTESSFGTLHMAVPLTYGSVVPSLCGLKK